MTIAQDNELDNARNELDALHKATSEAKDRIVEILRALAPFNYGGCEDEALDSLLSDHIGSKEHEIEKRISECENAVSADEDRDMRRNAPIVL